MKKIRSLTAILLSVILMFSFSVTCFAVENTGEYVANNDLCEVEVSLDELEGGIDLYVIQHEDGTMDIIKSNENSDNDILSTLAEITFHVGLTRVQTNKGILYWKAVMPQLKKVTGTMYCKDTSFLFPETYASASIISPRLDGTEGIAGNSTSSFYIPSPIYSFRVGFSNVIMTSITQTISIGNGSSVVDA